MNVRWLILAAVLAQVSAPQSPTNLRFVDGSGTCTGGMIGAPPDCFPAPPAPVANGEQWGVKLTPCFDWNFGGCTNTFNTGKERYLPSQVQVSSGTAKLVAEPLVPPYANSACYQFCT